MTWHTQTVTAEALAFLLARIKAMGGTIAHSRPGPGGVQVTWTTMTSDLTLKDAFSWHSFVVNDPSPISPTVDPCPLECR